MADDQRLEKNLVSWGSHIFKIDGVRWFGLTNIEFDEKNEPAYGYGMTRSHAPISRTAGKYTPGVVKLTWHKHSAILFNQYLANRAPDGKSIGKVVFQAMLQVSEDDIVSETELVNCRVMSRASKAEENPDPNMRDIEIHVMRIIEDGTTLYDSTEE